ncbi:3-phosphoshikimate 1-carboxyvinyltransferase [Rubrobacter marinus]|uniref:3-phosphoshikimate 1-carboxyvinyltransferase n=1 Tax=Rubrobacter marinus TaxID=2653852 RepID=A0A6G8PXF1_9ACTN|nr:3-phosphoshikimate 1-carboxyvinyltransferase [Rubrobacter marinus]QIN78899.1 3-phosphoshikimate 1-carboxyvinyltransferase [Rubrobacter marinus]
MSGERTRPVAGVPGVDFTVDDVRGRFPVELEIKPLSRPVDATVRVPGSKSVTNRALVVAALADGRSRILNPLFSDDSYWLMDALVRLGFGVRADREGGEVEILGLGGRVPNEDVEVFVGNAGTVARFLPPALALGPGPYRLDGVPRMRERPVGDLVDAMRELGAAVRYADGEGRFPLVVEGGGLRGGTASVEGSKSSQFLSGLLMAAPYAREGMTLEVEGELVSKPYVGITTGVMRSFGVGVEEEGGRFTVRPAAYGARDYPVEPDASGASYFMAAAAVTGGRVEIPGLGSSSPQGDLRFAEVLERMGCEVRIERDRVAVQGPRRLRGVDVDMNAFSDTMITLAAIAPFADGPTTIRDVEHTRHQETDRISAVATELARLGADVREHRNGIRIIPRETRPTSIRTYDDHRMAMGFAVTGLVAAGISIQNPACVTKTFPDFFRKLDALR